MDQTKIGAFIAAVRKEQGMTQAALAKRLGITDRAVSKWENGRGMPELSLIKPLCDALGITVNEFLAGERIEPQAAAEKAEETLLHTLKDSRRGRRAVAVLGAVLLVGAAILAGLFGVDVSRMRRGLPVVFSTWGFSYAPDLHVPDWQMEQAARNYLTDHGDAERRHHPGEKTFVRLRVFLVQQTEDDRYSLYAWAVTGKFYGEDGQVRRDSGASYPIKFLLETQDEDYVVTGSETPRDGGYYGEDMARIFPASVRHDMEWAENAGEFAALEDDVEELAELYFASPDTTE